MPRPSEEKVARSLRACGARCIINTRLPGATDIIASWPSGTSWRIQVKCSEVGKPKKPSKEELRRLKETATKNGQTPVVAYVYLSGRIKYFSARTGKRITPPDVRKKRKLRH